MKQIFSTLFLMLWAIAVATAQEKPKWDVSNPPGDWNFNEVNFTANEGTWMNLDVSPDGKEIVFDLLGDIYSMPIAGGQARLLRGGLAFEVQPRYSPDGQWISFTSDAGGGDNIWVMKRDGAEARQVTKEDFRLLNNAVWTPDGQYLIARKHFTSGRSLGAGEMWMYHITGGSGIQLTKRRNDQQDVNEPSVSPDGRYLYYSEDMYPGGFFQYNKDPNSQIYVIKRYDRVKGDITTITGGPGSASRPQVSRNGHYLAFVKRVREKSVLFLHDLRTGEEWPIYDELHKDQQEAWAIFGTYTGFNWSVDDKQIIIWAKGKIRQIEVATLATKEIPFEAQVNVKIAEALHFKNKAFEEEIDIKVIRQAVTSPDGKTLVFNAAGYLWKKALPDGKPVRLTASTDFEFEPSFSKSGDELVYVTWNDETGGAIMKWNLRSKKPVAVKITTERAIYRSPTFSPDGSRIVYVKESGNDHQGYTFAKDPGIYLIPANGGKSTLITREGDYPVFSLEGDRIIYQTGGYFFGNLTKSLKSVNLSGGEERTLVQSKYANRLVLSPDQKWIAFILLHKAYVAAMPQVGQVLDLDAKSTHVPVSPIARDAGINLHWSADSRRVHWTIGDEYFSNNVKDRFAFLDGSPEKVGPVDTVGVKIGLRLPADKPSGILALKGARIITMEGDQVIEAGTILIQDNRIVAVGPVSEVPIPAGAQVMDLTGKTIMPGLVDAHAHLGAFRYGLSPQKHWQYYTNLAYGVTTTHDPSANSEMVFSQSEMVKTGAMVGPRIYSTGTIIYGADGDFKAVINSYDDALSALRRTQAFGAFSVKSYNQPRRDQRQQIIRAARHLGMLVVPEGGSTFYHNLSMIMDGHTGIEHNIPVTPIYKDVITLWKSSKTAYTPTLIVNYGGLNGEYYWYQHTNVWEDEKLLRFTPRGPLEARSRHRTMIPDMEYENGHILVSKDCKVLADAGVNINLGAHGQIQGIGAHWELWMFAQGGMRPMEALRAATLNGAAYLGMSDEIGSLRAGKLADLIVLEKNPLENIQNSNSLLYTMVNGRLYDTETMNEVGLRDKVRSRFYWEQNKYNQQFEWHESTHSFHAAGCGCSQ